MDRQPLPPNQQQRHVTFDTRFDSHDLATVPSSFDWPGEQMPDASAHGNAPRGLYQDYHAHFTGASLYGRQQLGRSFSSPLAIQYQHFSQTSPAGLPFSSSHSLSSPLQHSQPLLPSLQSLSHPLNAPSVGSLPWQHPSFDPTAYVADNSQYVDTSPAPVRIGARSPSLSNRRASTEDTAVQSVEDADSEFEPESDVTTPVRRSPRRRGPARRFSNALDYAASPSPKAQTLQERKRAAADDADDRSFKRTRYPDQDEDNRLIFRLRTRQFLSWRAIVEQLNNKLRALGRTPNYSEAAVYGRFKRNGPKIAAAAGQADFDVNDYLHLRTGAEGAPKSALAQRRGRMKRGEGDAAADDVESQVLQLRERPRPLDHQRHHRYASLDSELSLDVLAAGLANHPDGVVGTQGLGDIGDIGNGNGNNNGIDTSSRFASMVEDDALLYCYQQQLGGFFPRLARTLGLGEAGLDDDDAAASPADAGSASAGAAASYCADRVRALLWQQ